MSSSLTLPPILMRPSRKLSSCIRRTPLQTSFLLKASMSQYAAACNKSLNWFEMNRWQLRRSAFMWSLRSLIQFSPSPRLA